MKINNEQVDFLKDNVKGRICEELADLFNKRFGTNLSKHSIKHYKRSLGLKSEIDGRFKKNQEPHNKKRIGDEFVDKNTGYTYIKIAEPNTWIQKQRYIYIKHHGKIDDDCSIIFLNGDKKDFDINNLKMVRNKDKLVMKNLHLFSDIEEITECGILIAKTINKCYELTQNKELEKDRN